MATPLELRTARRTAQRACRLALNDYNASLDDWKRAVGEGKDAASRLANALLTWRHVPSLLVGVLQRDAALQAAAQAKLARGAAEHLARLRGWLALAQEAVVHMRAALESVEKLLGGDPGRLLAASPVFASLPLDAIGTALRGVLSMHARELETKAAVVAGFDELLAELPAGPEGTGASGSQAADHRQKQQQQQQPATQAEERVRRASTLYCTAWLLSPRVDEPAVEGALARLAADMRGF